MSAQPRLAYTVHPGAGPYLALLHGFMSSSAQWMHNLDALARVCTPVTIDLWGHGASPAPADARSYRPTGYVEALERIRAELGAERWCVCGYSIGAGLTIRYAHTYPHRVSAQLFTNSASGFADAEQAGKWAADADESAARIVAGGHAAMERIPVHPRFARNLPGDVYDALLADAARLSPQGVAHLLKETTPNASVRDIAAENTVPALLCHGQKEKRFADARRWAVDHMAQLDVVELDAGHAVNMEDSAGFNAAAAEFITRHAT